MQQIVYRVDSDGSCVRGTCFAVGSGALLAHGILDANYNSSIVANDAVALAIAALKAAIQRDNYSGGYINVFMVNSTGYFHIRRQIL